MRPVILVSCLCVLLSSCAARPDHGGWQNGALPPQQWSRDYAACRAAAERDLLRGEYVDPEAQRSSNPMRQAEAQRQTTSVSSQIASCMRGLGYQQLK